MKPLIKSVLFTSALVIGANALMAQPSNGYVDQWYRAKYGRSSPMEEARQRADQANVAYREDTSAKASPVNTWFEDFWVAKYGQHSPMEQARQRADQANVAYREDASAKASPANTWFEDFTKAKYGQSLRR